MAIYYAWEINDLCTQIMSGNKMKHNVLIYVRTWFNFSFEVRTHYWGSSQYVMVGKEMHIHEVSRKLDEWNVSYVHTQVHIYYINTIIFNPFSVKMSSCWKLKLGRQTQLYCQ